MKAEHVNAFIDATRETFNSMCGISNIKRNGPVGKVGGEIIDVDELVSLCGLTGEVKGAVMLSTPLATGMKIVSKFLMEDINTINCDLMDGWGELLNILAGAADAKISDFKINLALPSVIIGSKGKFYAKAGNPFFLVPLYVDDFGPFSLGISLEILKK